jgi:beta-lactam-binding protein with PASTA domain
LAPQDKCLVPNVVGKMVAEAKAAIKTGRCRRGRVKRVRSDLVAKGLVVSQRPDAGTLRKLRGRVNLVVSRGPRR